MIVVSSLVSIICALLLIVKFLRSKKKASNTPIARMVCTKSLCDLIVAAKFLLAIFLPSHSSSSPWCFLQYTIGQLVALISCCYNAIICMALYFVFSRFSSAPLVDIIWIISPRNQVLMLGFCIAMWLVPVYHHQVRLDEVIIYQRVEVLIIRFLCSLISPQTPKLNNSNPQMQLLSLLAMLVASGG